MESKDALSELLDPAVRKDYEEMSRVFKSKGVATLAPGDQLKVLDRTFGGWVRVRTSSDQECWTVVSVLSVLRQGTDTVDSTASAVDQSRVQAETSRTAASPNPQPSAAPPIPAESNVAHPAQAIIGKWWDEKLMSGGVIISIYRQDGKLYRQMDCKSDGSSLKDEAVEKHSPLGRRFQAKEPSEYGDYLIIDREGNLQLWDRQGFVETARRIE
jgi:hypothetical protein